MQHHELFVASAVRTRGARMQRGVAFLRPHYYAFAPREAEFNAVARGAAAMAGAFAGYAVRWVPPGHADLGAFVARAWTWTASQFDDAMRTAIPACGWTCLTPRDTTVRRWKPLLGSGFNPWFERNGESYRLEAKVARPYEAVVDGLLRGWRMT